MDIDTDGLLVTCIGFRPEALKEPSGVCFQVKGAGSLGFSKYEITLGDSDRGPLFHVRQRVEDLFTVVFSRAAPYSSPGITSGIIFDRTLKEDAPADSLGARLQEKEGAARANEMKAERLAIPSTYINLLWKAHNKVMRVKYKLEHFQELPSFNVASTKIAAFAEAFRDEVKALADVTRHAFRHVRTFFQFQHGHRNTIQEDVDYGKTEAVREAVHVHLNSMIFNKFHMHLVSSVSGSLGAQVGVDNCSIYCDPSFLVTQRGNCKALRLSWHWRLRSTGARSAPQFEGACSLAVDEKPYRL